MIVEYNDKKYIVKFGYYHSRRKTLVECVIYTKEQGYDNPEIKGITEYPYQYFCKKKARNIALKYVLSDYHHDFRMSVWDAYFIESNIYPRNKKVKYEKD